MANDSLPHPTSKGIYQISIGFHVLNGVRTQRKHSMGRDKTAAYRMARALHLAWDNETTVDSSGKKIWGEGSIEAALNFATPTPKVQTTEPTPVMGEATPVAPKVTKGHTVDSALAEFQTYTKTRNDIGGDSRDAIDRAIKHIRSRLADITLGKVMLANVAVKDVDMEWLDSIRHYILGRPTSRRVTGKPIAVNTVLHWMVHFGAAFDWFSKTTRIGWIPPHAEWREKFAISSKQKWAIMTPEERDTFDKPPPCFSVGELAMVYKCGTALQRRYLLMGLLLGWAQEGIDSFRRDHFVEKNGEYYIDRRRGKTGVSGYWWVAPELAGMLKEAMAKTPSNKDGYAFTNAFGESINSRTDSIRLAWEAALKNAPISVRDLPFGRVKKRGAQLVQDISGSDHLTQLFLAQKAKTVMAKHYASSDAVTADVSLNLGKSPYERLHDTQREIWKRIKPLFYPAKVLAKEVAA